MKGNINKIKGLQHVPTMSRLTRNVTGGKSSAAIFDMYILVSEEERLNKERIVLMDRLVNIDANLELIKGRIEKIKNSLYPEGDAKIVPVRREAAKNSNFVYTEISY